MPVVEVLLVVDVLLWLYEMSLSVGGVGVNVLECGCH